MRRINHTRLRVNVQVDPKQFQEAAQRQGDEDEATLRAILAYLDRPNYFEQVREGGTCKPGLFNRIDSSLGNVSAFLPRVGTAEARDIYVVKTSASNTVTLVPVNAPINGATTLALTAIGVHRIVCDGEAFYK